MDTEDTIQVRVKSLCSQILTSSLNQITALVHTHQKLNSFKKYPGLKNEGYLDEKLVNLRNQMIKNTAKDHMDLLKILDEFKNSNANPLESTRLNMDIESISGEIRDNYEKK
jgi:hypothetical protein